MLLNLALAILATTTTAGEARRNPALLMRPTILNIGHICRWEARCMRNQERAMNRAARYVPKYRPPAWKIGLCNRNASRGPSRVDWIGLNNCLRNPRLPRPAPQRGRRN